MKFGFVTIYVQDFERSIAFYKDILGLNLLSRMQNEGHGMAFLGEPGQPSIELLYDREYAGVQYSGLSVGISVDDLDAAMEMMERAGRPLLRGPISPAPGVRFAFYHDPDGVEIELIEQK